MTYGRRVGDPGTRGGTRLRSALFALLLLVVGCAPDAGETMAPMIDLLTLSPPVTRLEGSPLPKVSPGPWNFSQGLPEGWRAGPDGVRVSLREGGVLLEHPEEPPWMELRTRLDLRRQATLEAELMPLSGVAAEFYYATTDPPSYGQGLRTVAHFKKTERTFSFFKFDLPGHEAVEGVLQVIRFYPGSWNGLAVVRQIRVLPRSSSYFQSSVFSKNRLALGQDFRRCWRFSGAGERSVNFIVPGPETRLRFSTGTLIGGGTARLTITLEERGSEKVTLIDTAFHSEGEGWTEHQTLLGPWAGREVTLRFTVFPAGPPAIRLVGTPMLFVPESTLPGATEADSRKNVLIILVDALRTDRLSLYGHHRRTSPHLSSLAADSLLFTNALAPCSWTAPSVASLFTGYYPGRLGISWGRPHNLPRHQATLAERFSMAGFSTAAFVANFVLGQDQGFSRGFDTYDLAPFGNHHLTARELSDRALAWLRQHRDERSLCYLHYIDPHSPYDAPAPEGRDATEHARFQLGQGGHWRDGNIWPLILERQWAGKPGDVAFLRRRYDEEVAYTDRQIGRLLTTLKAEGLLHDTLVLITADHGEELHDHGYWGHGYTLYQEVTRVPMILRLPGPGAPRGRLMENPVSLIDVMPTLLDLAGVEEPGDAVEGRSLLAPEKDRTVFSRTHADGPLRFSLWRGPYKYLVFDRAASGEDPLPTPQGRWLLREGPEAEELYHLGRDPAERENLLQTLPGIAADLRREVNERLDIEEAARRLSEGGPEASDLEERLRAMGYIE